MVAIGAKTKRKEEGIADDFSIRAEEGFLLNKCDGAADFGGGFGGEGCVVDGDSARVDGDDADDCEEEGGFSGTGGTEDGDFLAGVDGEGDVLDEMVGTADDDNLIERNQGILPNNAADLSMSP